jgi:hypothetical protein
MRHKATGQGSGPRVQIAAVVAVLLFLQVGMGGAQTKVAKAPAVANSKSGNCVQAVFDGRVKAGQAFEREFAPGLKFLLEPLPQGSGWIVRVVPVGQPRGVHDYAELATPPYRSVTPLAVSTDFAFRAQDAVGWNPRRFRYAQNAAVARHLEGLYAGVMANDAAAGSRAAELSTEQPEGVLQILNAVMVPGTANQWQMAAAVALHFEDTPHEVVQGAQPTPLGRLEELEFRVKLELAPGVPAEKGVDEEKIPCAIVPTVASKQPL